MKFLIKNRVVIIFYLFIVMLGFILSERVKYFNEMEENYNYNENVVLNK